MNQMYRLLTTLRLNFPWFLKSDRTTTATTASLPHLAMAPFEVNPSLYFECSICTEEIDDSWKILPCQHVFCLACLRRIYDGAVEENQNPQCPTCRKQIAVPLRTLQKPRLLYELYETMKVSNRSRQKRTKDDPIDSELIATALRKSAEETARKMELDSLLSDLEAMKLSILDIAAASVSNASNRNGNGISDDLINTLQNQLVEIKRKVQKLVSNVLIIKSESHSQAVIRPPHSSSFLTSVRHFLSHSTRNFLWFCIAVFCIFLILFDSARVLFSRHEVLFSL